jgi:hypothetical protein
MKILKTDLIYLVNYILENIQLDKELEEISMAAGVAGFTAPININYNINKKRKKKKKKINTL